MIFTVIVLAVVVTALLLDRKHLKTQIAALEADALKVAAAARADVKTAVADVVADAKKL